MKDTENIPKLNIIFAYTSLEPIPDKLWNLKPVRVYVTRVLKKDRFRIILDSTYFEKWMYKLDNYEMRGRPDIIHFCLMNIMESIANKLGFVKIWIHTINEKIIEVRPDVRLPKHYERFKGVMAALFRDGQVPKKGDWLLRIREDLDLKKLLDQFDRLVLLSDKGVLKSPDEVVSEVEKGDNVAFIIGAFPHGDFPMWLYERVDCVYSIFPDVLMAWVVTYEIVSSYERKYLFDQIYRKQ